MSMSRKKCCVPGCLESESSHPTKHMFPNPAKDKKRFNEWVYSIGGDILGLDDEDIFKHRSVCHAHFEERFCCRYNRLSNIAVPTLNLPGPLSLPRFTFVERRPLTQIENFSKAKSSTYMLYDEPSTSGLHDEPSTSGLHNEPSTSGLHDMPTNSTIVAGSQKESSAQTILDIVESQNIGPTMKQNIECCIKPVAKGVNMKVRKRVRLTPEEKSLHQKLTRARIKLSKCRNLIKKQSASLKAAKNITFNPNLLATLEKFPSTRKILTMLQFKGLGKKNKGQRFSLQEKILALSIFKRAPKGYKFLRKMLILPAPQTLAKLISQANLKPGINKKIFSQLENATKKMKTEEKLCILLFDEMFLKANMSYNERKDKVTGFVNDGQQNIPEFADHAQVFMIRGLIKNYKQPVSYSFSAAATSGQQIAKQIKAIVTELQKAGIIVVATVCDQGANNRQAIKLLIQETRGAYLRAGEEPKENVVLINDQEVIPLYDPPHLLKCIRNNLLTKDLQYIGANNTKRTAKWEHLILLHKENPDYKGVRLIPKLTENHVLPEKVSRNKMKVKYASQIFSRSVATNMGYLADKGILPPECSETADILLFFDNLFDSQNGSYDKKSQKFAKPLLGPVTPKSVHHKEWTEAKKKLKLMKFIHPATGKVENVPSLNNWVWTLDGTEVLLKKLKREYNITSVWMRHLNQDPIENFFGAIRSHGCRNTNPTPEHFEGAFTTLLINNMSSVHAPAGANCEEDLCSNLHALIITNDCNTPTTCEFDYVDDIVIDDVNNKRDPRIMGPLQYVGGYFIRNVKKNVFKACKTCASNVIATDSIEYIKYREYAGRQWLCSPTEPVITCISAIQDVTNTIIKKSFHADNLKELIKTYILMCIEFNFFECLEHKDDNINYLINLTTRFFLYNYCKDLNKILNGKMECYDEDDNLQMKAKKYHKKCCKRPIKK